jgi:N-glycosylase/DNA lyase
MNPCRITEIDLGDEIVRFDWGEPFELGSAAYWVEQAGRANSTRTTFALGDSLAEEITACLLGGYGVPAPVGLAAFEQLRKRVDLEGSPDPACVIAVLEQPLTVRGRQRPIRYRFPRQRGQRIASALAALHVRERPRDPLLLRDWLLDLPGIGLKTASWIVRNHTGSDEVAIIDVHIWRAGVSAGFFSDVWRLPTSYHRFEQAFLEVARIGGVRPSVLDAHIWYELQRLGRDARIFCPTYRPASTLV